MSLSQSESTILHEGIICHHPYTTHKIYFSSPMKFKTCILVHVYIGISNQGIKTPGLQHSLITANVQGDQTNFGRKSK